MTLRIVAHLRSGFASKFPWSPSIDGILAYVERMRALGPEEFALTQADLSAQKPNESLPLQMQQYGDTWWYQCSSPIYQAAIIEVRHLHRRFNAVEAETYMEGSRKIETTKGPYKNARFQVQHRVTNRVEWHANGDRAAIEDMLRDVTHIGAKMGAGFGMVRAWEVREDGDEETAVHHRPLPQAYAESHGISGIVMRWGYRPPIRIPENIDICVIPHARP
jgi:CRISPR type IV-associated protein Csf3